MVDCGYVPIKQGKRVFIMKGADEYYDLFRGESEQIGRLYFQLHTHARGKCFEVFLLPKGVDREADKGKLYGGYPPMVELYGVISGQRGWTECYGWLREGPWVEDFDKIMDLKREESKCRELERLLRQEAEGVKRENLVRELLQDYP